MLLVIRHRRRVKWPSERSEWLLDAAAARHNGNKPDTLVSGSVCNLLSSGKRSNGSLARGSVEGEGFLLDHPVGIKGVYTPPANKKEGLVA